MIKPIGFIKEHDQVSFAISIENAMKSDEFDAKQRLEIVKYLSKGTVIHQLMSYFEDLETNKAIEPFGFVSDGVYVWPSYFPYYLKKYNKFSLDSSFIEHIKNKKRKFCFFARRVSISKLENEFIELYESCLISSK